MPEFINRPNILCKKNSFGKMKEVYATRMRENDSGQNSPNADQTFVEKSPPKSPSLHNALHTEAAGSQNAKQVFGRYINSSLLIPDTPATEILPIHLSMPTEEKILMGSVVHKCSITVE